MDRSSPETYRLTFDDGPNPVWTPRVLDALDEAATTATFFVVAPLAIRHPHLVERALEEGHEVALHCERHIRHTELAEEEIRDDTRRGLEDLARLGVSPSGWRPPWGVVTDGTQRVADAFGLEIILWTSDTHDWRGDGSEEMLRAIMPDLTEGAIILMHDGLGPGARRRGCRETVDLIPPLVDKLRDLGLVASFEPERGTTGVW